MVLWLMATWKFRRLGASIALIPTPCRCFRLARPRSRRVQAAPKCRQPACRPDSAYRQQGARRWRHSNVGRSVGPGRRLQPACSGTAARDGSAPEQGELQHKDRPYLCGPGGARAGADAHARRKPFSQHCGHRCPGQQERQRRPRHHGAVRHLRGRQRPEGADGASAAQGGAPAWTALAGGELYLVFDQRSGAPCRACSTPSRGERHRSNSGSCAADLETVRPLPQHALPRWCGRRKRHVTCGARSRLGPARCTSGGSRLCFGVARHGPWRPRRQAQRPRGRGRPITVPSRRSSAAPYCLPVLASISTACTEPTSPIWIV
jgi:hypothetical protein